MAPQKCPVAAVVKCHFENVQARNGNDRVVIEEVRCGVHCEGDDQNSDDCGNRHNVGKVKERYACEIGDKVTHGSVGAVSYGHYTKALCVAYLGYCVKDSDRDCCCREDRKTDEEGNGVKAISSPVEYRPEGTVRRNEHQEDEYESQSAIPLARKAARLKAFSEGR